MKRVLFVLLLAFGSASAQDPSVHVFNMRAVIVNHEQIDTTSMHVVMGFTRDSVCFMLDRHLCFRILLLERTPESTFMRCENEFSEQCGVRIVQASDGFLMWIMQKPPSPSYFLTSKIP